MSAVEQKGGIAFKDIRINSISSVSGVFSGCNRQNFWYSDDYTQSGFGTLMGEDNTLVQPSSIVTDPDSSKEVLEYFERLMAVKIGKRGI